MRMEELVGHRRPTALLQRSLLNGRVSNAYLFVGEEGIGKTLAAIAFGRALVCENPDARPEHGIYEACGHCRSCLLSAAGNHPDLRVIAPEGERIRIDQMRDLRHEVSLTAFGGARRAYIIQHAEAMTEESANCILKTLEEPPPGVTLILVTESLSQLLPTILSRCQIVRFRPAAPGAIEALLVERHHVPAAHARFIASISGGRAGWAVRAAQQPAILDVRERLMHLLARLPEADPVFVFRAAEEIRDMAVALADAGTPEPSAGEAVSASGASSEDRQIRANADAVLDIARAWFRDLLVLKMASEMPLINVDRRGELETAAERTPLPRIHKALDALSHTRYYLARNANVSLALEVMMARLVVGG
ncbi:MAG TPA: DNA polymerase III subunit delta' [Armatimonadota bacterium]|jgi:DNA polymerase-3 subunit delta'|nr:DNA polymerase III subunit delta' [Armatimonadota bacterium]HPO73712.1 DNA polymerase III subunit delta' [Armatimonadota bacterium]HPT96968.1 DNA polymerase III subunit delta' [Armatimonadota bacterium]